MFIMYIISLIIFFIAFLTMLISIMISKKTFYDREKCSPFECGFDPKSKSRLPFSLRFFLIAIIFLIFDVEIALLMPMIIIMNYSNLAIWLTSSVIFIIILLIGLYHEWNQGALEWTN